MTRILFQRASTKAAKAAKAAVAFRYLIQHIAEVACPADEETLQKRVQTVEETLLPDETAGTEAFYRHPETYLINISALSRCLIEKLMNP
ncbi:hypothetical protein [Desulfosarcina cetonica]|uniref:hypothetical protein n=1 Tax=Desulfosarcina cetonica TaxID=90730 RepID=UPI0006D097C2|nr:hypothetical protein [Desulfosarcina cetonica]